MFSLASLIILSGCGTITPKVEESHTASFSGNTQNSGVIEVTENGALITENLAVEYNAFIKEFGDKTTPKTPRNFGLTKLESGNYLLTLEGLSRLKELQIIRDREKIDHAGTLLDKVGL